MKVLPKITNMKCGRVPSLVENYIVVNFNNDSNVSLAYKETESSDFNVLQDLLECRAYATALLYLNETYILSDKYSDLLKEANIKDFYNDCEELLTKNIKIVEEAGIPLTEICGYKIFEGAGYILRGNGKKKIRESFNERGEIDLADITLDYLKNREYDAQIIGMAKCPSCGNIFDREDNAYDEEIEDVVPYPTLSNPYNERKMTYTNKKLKCPYCGDSDNEEDYAWAWVDDLYDAPNAEELIPGFNTLNEDAEGTQCADIAPKLDQKSGVVDTKPKKEKKYYDILLSGLDEHEDLKVNKGFMKNLDGYYQRGNYILVKEGDKYLAVHKDKLKEYQVQGDNVILDRNEYTTGTELEDIAKALKSHLQNKGIDKDFSFNTGVVDGAVGLVITRKNKNIDLVSVHQSIIDSLKGIGMKDTDFDSDIKKDSVVVAILNPHNKN